MDTSVILTIHNKERLVAAVVGAILRHASEAVKELIVVLDGCTDGSEAAFDRTVGRLKPGVSIKRIHADDVWETKANNLGMRASTCPYLCLVQDDMVIREWHFDRRMRAPLMAFSDCFAVTANIAHDKGLDGEGKLIARNQAGRDNAWNCGRVESAWRRFRDNFTEREAFKVRDVVNRGPLMGTSINAVFYAELA
jgi:glycosyltransferase involved in cell wall biosynthesis